MVATTVHATFFFLMWCLSFATTKGAGSQLFKVSKILFLKEKVLLNKTAFIWSKLIILWKMITI